MRYKSYLSLRKFVFNLLLSVSKHSIVLGLSIIFFLGTHLAHSQNIGINTTGAAPSASAILDIVSTDQGLLIPRLTDAQRQALKDPATGLMIYNTTSNELNFYNGSNWKRLPGSSVSVVSAGGAGPGGGIAINTTGAAADASAILDITSTDKGILVPRVTDACAVTAVGGLNFYNSVTNQAVFYNGSKWKVLCDQTIDNNKGAGATAAGAAINSTGAVGNASAILDLTSTTQGLLIPRMTSAQRDLIKTPATGLMIYNSTNSRMEYWMGTAWYTITTGTGFQTEWTTTAPAETITLPLNSGNGSAFNCMVDWGDGSSSCITAVADPDITHTYAAAGTYTVEITGQCEGWSFDSAGDNLKIKRVLNWGDACAFDGFKYLERGFSGCMNLTSIGTGSIPASGTGCAIFYNTFFICFGLTGSIPTDLFRYHTLVSSSGFDGTFFGCSGLTGAIPTDLFRYNTLVSSSGFRNTFGGCSSLTGAIPTDLFRYNTLVSDYGFSSTFNSCSNLTGAIPTDLFRYNTLVSSSGFYSTFFGCSGLTSIPTDLFRYNTLVSTQGFSSTFQTCTGLIAGAIPTDLFRYNTAVSSQGFQRTFSGCIGLTSLPPDLFKYNTACTNFQETFNGCTKLVLNRNIFFADGEEGTRFLNQSVDFTSCFSRTSFTGAQGQAPFLWNCSFGTGTATKTTCFGGAGNSTTSLSNYPDELITLDVSPATDWAAGDIITGQTSGRTCTVVSKITATTYIVKSRGGLGYTLGEIIGVTGVPAKLADQGAAYPTFAASGWR